MRQHNNKKMKWYKLFSMELGVSYMEQNDELTDEELDDALISDKPRMEGILGELTMSMNGIEELQ